MASAAVVDSLLSSIEEGSGLAPTVEITVLFPPKAYTTSETELVVVNRTSVTVPKGAIVMRGTRLYDANGAEKSTAANLEMLRLLYLKEGYGIQVVILDAKDKVVKANHIAGENQPLDQFYKVENLLVNVGPKEAFLAACEMGYSGLASLVDQVAAEDIAEGILRAAAASRTAAIISLWPRIKQEMYRPVVLLIAETGNIEVMRWLVARYKRRGNNLPCPTGELITRALANQRYEFALFVMQLVHTIEDELARYALQTDKDFFDHLVNYQLLNRSVLLGAVVETGDILAVKSCQNSFHRVGVAPVDEWDGDECTYIMNMAIGSSYSLVEHFSNIHYRARDCLLCAARLHKPRSFIFFAKQLSSIDFVPDELIMPIRDQICEPGTEGINDDISGLPIIRDRSFQFTTPSGVQLWYDRYSILHSFDVQEDLRVWNPKENRTIDDTGFGGEPSAEKVYILPPSYVIDERSKNALSRMTSGRFVLVYIHREVRIGNASGHFGQSSLHGQVPGYDYMTIAADAGPSTAVHSIASVISSGGSDYMTIGAPVPSTAVHSIANAISSGTSASFAPAASSSPAPITVAATNAAAAAAAALGADPLPNGDEAEVVVRVDAQKKHRTAVSAASSTPEHRVPPPMSSQMAAEAAAAVATAPTKKKAHTQVPPQIQPLVTTFYVDPPSADDGGAEDANTE